ncbi:MAG: DUF2791 family P-loop domain-containing protein, partial [Candidatus Tectomicrobia bacterium]|nr:DUF2791 family P-loop domain-containing protein [Candidatus Tectomicrobia bacterium]
MDSDKRTESRRAIEALRAGVPNQDAVNALGSSQPELEKTFRERLEAACGGFQNSQQSNGMLVTGDFGSGKSHLLEYFKHIALEENFVCSKIVISKETPLYHPAKVYRSAIESAVVPDRRGTALSEITTRLNFESEAYTGFYKWVHSSDAGLNTQFAATVFLFEYAKGNDELRDRIIRFWSGDPITMSELKRYLKETGEAASYKIDRTSVRELAQQRYSFIPHLMVAAGYSGWVLLIDEAELIGRYSLRQRARSYAELARFLGKLEGAGLPGLFSVFTMSGDFESAVLDYRNDEEKIPAKFRGAGNPDDSLMASQAERGMRLIRQEKLPLERLNLDKIKQTHEVLRSVYHMAYGWEPPAEYTVPDTTARIRQHVKRWITEWDLKRFYPDYRSDIEISQLKQDYEESPDMEQPDEETVETQEN